MILLAVTILALAWYVLCWLGLLWSGARRAVDRLSPYTRWLHAWVLSAPATFAYVAVFTAFTLVQRTTPPHLIDVLTRVNSTNLVRLHHAPLAVLADSAMWVADRGAGLTLYILAFVTVVAWAEQRYGPPRMIVIGLSGHVLGTLLTALVELHAIEAGHAPHRLAHTTDVGVSYIMVAGCVAAVLLMRGWWLVTGITALAVGVVWPVISNHTIWALGHLLAALCGLVVAALCRFLGGVRRPRDLRPCLRGPERITTE
ncbi:rhomboid-like protein [Actinoallomurus rhizosphaericola]|uniref:rhomboid-like protein n=1 Tax=Actinoallomurus rhizosphaericola TaxID=2952536 RepID=UPI00209089B3|nr:rhomboid-like protein [Actinoallomurus rhizosphaericola]MCO5992507.1 hypothetical protein [Actinoallomurus rhizosphaericola]